MTKQEIEKITDLFENEGYNVYYSDSEFEFGLYTDAGEDGHFTIQADSVEEFKDELYEYACYFDVDEDVEMQMQCRDHPSARICVENAEWKAQELDRLAHLALDL